MLWFSCRQRRINVFGMFCLLPILLFSACLYASPESELHRSQAILAINDARLDDALNLLNQAIEADPGDYESIYLRGSVYLRLNKPNLAQDDFLRVKRAGKGDQQIDKQIALTWILIGRQNYTQARYKQALKDFQNSEQASASLIPVSRLWQARTLDRLGKHKQAIELLTQTLQKFPHSDVASGLRETLDQLAEYGGESPWEFGLRAGLANDSNIGLFPSDQTVPTGVSHRADTRAQVELNSRWSWQHSDNSNTIFSYRLFKANYLSTSGYNLFSQTLGIDQRMRYSKGYWGVNYQYLIADMDSFGQQTGGTLSAYHSHAFDSRHTGLSKLSLSTHDYTYSGYQGYSGSSLEGLYRLYTLGQNWNNKYYYGAILRQTTAQATQFTNSAFGIEAGLEHVWKSYHYGLNASIELHNYALRTENEGELLLYGSCDFSHNIQLELGLKSLTNTSSDSLYDYTRKMLYLIVGWHL